MSGMIQRTPGAGNLSMPLMHGAQPPGGNTAQAAPGDQFNGSGEDAGGQQPDPKTALIHALESEVQSLQGMIQQEELLADSQQGQQGQQSQQSQQQIQQQIQQLEQKLDADEKQLYDLTGGQEGYSGDQNGSQVAPPSSSGSSPSVGNNQGGAPTGSYGGPAPGEGGQSPRATGPGNTAPSSSYPSAAPQSGEAAVNLANSQLGKNAQNVNLANYTAAGGRTNDCADFVSAVLSDSGRFNKNSGDASVAQFKNDLLAQGYKVVPNSQAKPGDVFMSTRWSHTELVAGNQNGQLTGIGANGSGQERVTTNSIGTSGNPGFIMQKADGS